VGGGGGGGRRGGGGGGRGGGRGGGGEGIGLSLSRPCLGGGVSDLIRAGLRERTFEIGYPFLVRKLLY